MESAAAYLKQAARARRLARSITDEVVAAGLETLAEEYLAKASELGSGGVSGRHVPAEYGARRAS
jgi:hypothetical protein